MAWHHPVQLLWNWCKQIKLCLAGVREGQGGQLEAKPAAGGSLEAVAEEQAAAEGAARQARVRVCASQSPVMAHSGYSIRGNECLL